MSETPETFKPRPYQATAIEALNARWGGSADNRLAVVLPTGAGKTVVFANLILEHLDHLAARGKRALVIAHREELLDQAAAKIRAVAPTLRIGFVKAERDEHQGVDVIVASVQTLAVKRRRKALQDVGLIIVDECHHAAAPSYVEVLRHFGAWDGIPTAGFTATMHREDGGLADVWDDVVFTLDILEMIEDGYLCDVRGKRVTIPGLNLDKVKTRNGDLQEGQLGQALDDSGAAEVVAEAYRLHAGGRPGVVFTPTVATAQSMADAFNDAGIPAATIWGDMPKEARQTALNWYREGKVQVLTNCMVLTEGFDAPWTSCVVIARPTKSPGLYCQMAGRALRLWEDKEDALILDVMGATTRHKLASIVDLTGRDANAVEDDERSLREIVRATEEETKRAVDLSRIQVEEVNLFHESPVRWLRTDDGTWFIPLRDDTFLFLVRGSQPRSYRLRLWTREGGVRAPQQDPEAPLADVMRWAEKHAHKMCPPAFLRRAASWRSKEPTPKQRSWCRYAGIPIPRGSSAGDVADLQSTHRVAAVLSSTPLEALAA
ncbi:DEAD/DEAH box helicase [Streptomyces sp. NPDC001054]